VENITLTQTGAGLVVANGSWSTTMTGQYQDIVVRGAGSNCSIVVDASVTTDCTLYAAPKAKNTLHAGSGNDTLVSIGSRSATLVGGAGNDSFWADAAATQKMVGVRPDEAGNVHRVNGFYIAAAAKKGKAPQVKKVASGVSAEPATTEGATYANFSDQPLFAPTGPSENDIYQGQVGDCYFVSVLSSVAEVDPAKIEQSILKMSDGTYVVEFNKNGVNEFVRVDGQLPTNSNGGLEYAGLGTDGCIWVAIMEKAYTIFHGPSASYASIDSGWMDQSYSALGFRSTSVYADGSVNPVMAKVETAVAAGDSVTFGTNMVMDHAPLIDGHAYTVDSVNLGSNGTVVSLTLRNPWGIAGVEGVAANNGYVTITAQQAVDSMAGFVFAAV
jgi:hypothetical protein